MLVDSEPKSIWPLTKLGHGQQGQMKGGSEMGKYPHVRRNDNVSLPP